MTPFPSRHATPSRREWLARTGLGFGGIALATLLAEESRAAAPPRPAKTHFHPRAKRIIHLFLEGGPSHLDTFDPKPALSKHDGKPIDVPGESRKAPAFGSPFKFARRGQSGLEISDAFPRLAGLADELCVIRSMHTDDPGHEGAMLLMNCGDARVARPSVGSWVTYGLGAENANLPGFVVLYHEGQPAKGAENWQAAFLPGAFQAAAVDTKHTDPALMIEHARSPVATAAEQRQQLELLRQVNREHAARGRGDDERLEARVRSFELAYRMQAEVGEAFDTSREPTRLRDPYGDSPIGRQCLIARRLVERGVRFVQVYNSGWDHHSALVDLLRDQARPCDQAAAALVRDLRERGLLEDTLVVCCGEFGRTPVTDESPSVQGMKAGRGHNPAGFSAWLAGGGVKGGHVHGATDDFGFAAVKDKVHVHDLHATLLYLLGFDHERLTYRYSGRDFRLTDVHGRVVKEIVRG